MEQFFANLKALAIKCWGEGVQIAEADGQVLLVAFRTVWLAAQPGEIASLWPIIGRAVADVESGDLNDIETAVLMEAETNGLDFVEKLAEGVLPALIAIFKAAPAIPAA